jgi:hypothetical protein
VSEAKFKVNGTFVLPSRKLFVVHGEVLDGSVEPGMVATFPCGGFHPWRLEIDGVEVADWVRERHSEFALTFRTYEERLALLREAPVVGEVLILTRVTRSPCPCCGFYTLSQEPPCSYEICPVCFWEGDGVQFDDPDYAGGANRVSLNEARRRFRATGMSEPGFASHVRSPRPDEYPPQPE